MPPPPHLQGDGSSLQLGTGDFQSSPVPVQVAAPGGAAWAAVVPGARHTVGLLAGGAVAAWGQGGQRGVLGDPDLGEVGQAAAPALAPFGVFAFQALASGTDFACGLASSYRECGVVVECGAAAATSGGRHTTAAASRLWAWAGGAAAPAAQQQRARQHDCGTAPLPSPSQPCRRRRRPPGRRPPGHRHPGARRQLAGLPPGPHRRPRSSLL